MKKILFVLTSHDKLGTTGKKTGAYLSEITHAYDKFIAAGYEVDFVSPLGGQAPIDGVDLKDSINAKWYNDKNFKQAISHTKASKDVRADGYAAIYFAGGHGTMFDLPQDVMLAQITTQIYESNGVVGAVCHGPAGIVNVKLSNGEYLVKGKKVSAFTNEEEAAVELTGQMPFLLESQMIKNGGLYTKAEKFQKHVVADQRLVTGQNPASAAGVATEMIKIIQ